MPAIQYSLGWPAKCRVLSARPLPPLLGVVLVASVGFIPLLNMNNAMY